MAPQMPEDFSDNESISSLESEDDSESATSEPSNVLNQVSQADGVEDMEEEFHTEDSDLSNSEEDEQEVEGKELEGRAAVPDPPLLSAELLKPLPSPAFSQQHAVAVPWNQMTSKQKKTQRNRSRQAKKKEWDRLRQETKGAGVLEAGRVAQLKRGVVPSGEKVRNGRVTKTARPQASGRQRLLEQRKTIVGRSQSELARPKKMTTTKAKR